MSEYLTLNADFTNFNKDNMRIYGMDFFKSTVDMNLTSKSLKSVRYENVTLKLKCNVTTGKLIHLWDPVILEILRTGIEISA